MSVVCSRERVDAAPERISEYIGEHTDRAPDRAFTRSLVEERRRPRMQNKVAQRVGNVFSIGKLRFSRWSSQRGCISSTDLSNDHDKTWNRSRKQWCTVVFFTFHSSAGANAECYCAVALPFRKPRAWWTNSLSFRVALIGIPTEHGAQFARSPCESVSLALAYALEAIHTTESQHAP
eukprot:IDg18006t1